MNDHAGMYRRVAEVTTAASGIGTLLAGAGLLCLGFRARREVRMALARERITGSSVAGLYAPVASGAAARSLADTVRRNTLKAAGGRTYAETAPYLDANRDPTSDRISAAVDHLTGQPVQNPRQALWLQSTTLQTALMQAYMGGRIAEMSMGLGATLVVAGAGLTAAARWPR